MENPFGHKQTRRRSHNPQIKDKQAIYYAVESICVWNVSGTTNAHIN